jgi:hypothetical protein
MDSFSSRGIVCGMLLFVLFSGCGQRPEIRSYTVRRDAGDLMLGGILLDNDRGWFFKLTGPKKELAAKSDEFRTFLKSVRLNTSSLPTWELPPGWRVDDTPHQMRVATIRVPLESKAAELTVTVLPRQAGDEGAYLAANINRWRDQMGQGRLGSHDLESLEQIETRSGPAYVVSITGRMKSGGMAAPFAGRGA